MKSSSLDDKLLDIVIIGGSVVNILATIAVIMYLLSNAGLI